MTLRTRRPISSLASQTTGSQSRTPRTIPVIAPELFSSAAMAGRVTNENFSLTSGATGYRRMSHSRPVAVSSGPFPGDDEYYYPTSSAGMSYPSMSVSDGQYAVPVMSSLSSYEPDLTSEFLVDDAFSSNTSADLTFVPVEYPGQDCAQDVNSCYMPMEMPLYMPGMRTNFNAADFSRSLTPPPEDFVEDYLSANQISHEEPCLMDDDFNLCHTSTESLSQRILKQPRPIRSASERNLMLDGYRPSSISPPIGTTSPPMEDSSSREKARNHPWYDARPDKDGKYVCPVVHEGNCSHPPTTQRCVYNKYVDSHLRPYRCKFTERRDCEDLRFSSNACLLRHEREAHGEQNHGINPFMCKFKDCERARDGNGFPRRWNQRDHMKRVHQYDEPEMPMEKSSTGHSQTKRRKMSRKPTSVPMERSGPSAISRTQITVNASHQLPEYGPTSRTQYVSLGGGYTFPTQDYKAMMARPVTMSEVQFTQPAISRTSRVSPPYTGIYPS